MRRQSCFEPTDLDANRSRISARRSPFSSLTGSRRGVADNQFRNSTRNRSESGVGAADVTVSLLTPFSGGARNLSIDDGSPNNEAASRQFAANFDTSRRIDEPPVAPTHGSAPADTLEFVNNCGKVQDELRLPCPIHVELNDSVQVGSRLDEGSRPSTSCLRHVTTVNDNDDRQRVLSVVIDKHRSADEFNTFQPSYQNMLTSTRWEKFNNSK